MDEYENSFPFSINCNLLGFIQSEWRTSVQINWFLHFRVNRKIKSVSWVHSCDTDHSGVIDKILNYSILLVYSDETDLIPFLFSNSWTLLFFPLFVTCRHLVFQSSSCHFYVILCYGQPLILSVSNLIPMLKLNWKSPGPKDSSHTFQSARDISRIL